MHDVCVTSCNSDHSWSSESLLKEWKKYIFICKFFKALLDLFCSEQGSQKDDTEGKLYSDGQ
jgi:hypothetical protein